jgi:hypothetical protein
MHISNDFPSFVSLGQRDRTLGPISTNVMVPSLLFNVVANRLYATIEESIQLLRYSVDLLWRKLF